MEIDWNDELRENIIGHFYFQTNIDVSSLEQMEIKELYKFFYNKYFENRLNKLIDIKDGLALFAFAIGEKLGYQNKEGNLTY